MTSGSDEGLIARIRSTVRRLAAAGDASAPQLERLESLETRVAHLEQLVEGLQDSVYRESERHAKLIAELQTQVHPAAMRAALAEDAQNRGL